MGSIFARMTIAMASNAAGTGGTPVIRMTIMVKLFAVLRDKAGVAELRLALPEGASVSDAMELVLGRYPALAPFANRVACAVNLVRVDRQTVLNDGDELALLPPVSGG